MSTSCPGGGVAARSRRVATQVNRPERPEEDEEQDSNDTRERALGRAPHDWYDRTIHELLGDRFTAAVSCPETR